ncbi:MAG: ribonuclease P protein component [Nitrospirales bacterium]|nr:ribonuclease P protein component [Nitrospirales bacterium]
MVEKSSQDGERKGALVSQYRMNNPTYNKRPTQSLFIHHGRDFNRIKREGKRVVTLFFTAMIAPAPTQRGRVGIVVGRRLGKAVLRNRAKRIFRELVRSHCRVVPPKKDCIVFPRQASLTVKHQTLVDTWTKTLIHEEV